MDEERSLGPRAARRLVDGKVASPAGVRPPCCALWRPAHSRRRRPKLNLDSCLASASTANSVGAPAQTHRTANSGWTWRGGCRGNRRSSGWIPDRGGPVFPTTTTASSAARCRIRCHAYKSTQLFRGFWHIVDSTSR